MDAWVPISAAQDGLITRRQLREAGLRRHAVAHRVTRGQWQVLSSTVVATFSGEITVRQKLWLGLLHGGAGALIGGVHAAAVAGLKGWDRDVICVLVPRERAVPRPLKGYRFVRTRRDLGELRAPGVSPPCCHPVAAVLLFAAEQRNPRVAEGIIAAVVQQRLATVAVFLSWLDYLGTIRLASAIREALRDIDGGSQSVAELDVVRLCRIHGLRLPDRQVPRRDASGRARFTDCEWLLPDGRTLVLEVDGAFHLDVAQWEADIVRERALTGPDRTVVRCTARELRSNPAAVARDLRRIGVPLS